MELKKVKIYRYKGIQGCYGERYAVPDRRTRLIEIFNSIKIWVQDHKRINGEEYTVFELPIGKSGGFNYDIESNPLLMYWLEAQNAIIVEMIEVKRKGD